ncbi:hypothetical protein MTR_2g084935 [Medicago truncatula]|uniref:Uncharacterized protein n=1 Tax=Medicago truncatula TaxID=3880 RepID=A0A072VBI1_MEDTR|nr:hypothetical protein MTR_2g084935 [Medicago truncatula]
MLFQKEKKFDYDEINLGTKKDFTKVILEHKKALNCLVVDEVVNENYPVIELHPKIMEKLQLSFDDTFQIMPYKPSPLDGKQPRKTSPLDGKEPLKTSPQHGKQLHTTSPMKESNS